ncbi:SDR family NAD(P)-dependent oxidoreductase [Polymorphobacter fuscus]|uniref:SDR family NAD(P)-dependent oxidoreductase n=1 Tax=Sandarakinorhabdus fusca TaxID=1439888 RepID=A0A7C9KHC1_9SPHN|nr:SDR family NAD(P)-dependent oxidoreductase [Polymorphobacter fuscus]KAB7647482.1 SDR family NAD(P)-dependent oxidoreductase [Polymorphobacter fuscus]MQT16740.1 SDR family NAD(P)-dependent oxidoreductase [Polymorphobacter fuscus]NJC09272.1 short-subunit dehydrogenase [Polymorphobacter fuscus]
MDLGGKTIWITGASSGIGAGLATGFARAGARLVLSGRREAALAEVAGRCQGDSILLPFEATDLDALPSIVDRAQAMTGGIDILVNNAGISQRSLALDTDFDVYRRVMEVDFFAPLRLTQLVLPAMVKRRSGALVNIASVAGKVGSPLRTGYCAAKHALVGWSDALRAEIDQYSVSVFVVTPGFVATGIADNALTGDGSVKGHDASDPVNEGISADDAATIIIDAMIADRPEIPVGRDGAPEMQLLDFKRQNPEQLFAMMAGMAPKVPRA